MLAVPPSSVWPSKPPENSAVASLVSAVFGPCAQFAVKMTMGWPIPSFTRQEQRADGQALLVSLVLPEAAGATVFESLTHSGPVLIGIKSLGNSECEGVGVDLERADRVISHTAAKRFQIASELETGLPPLALWTVKEACFKANPDNLDSVVSQYRVQAPIKDTQGIKTGQVCFESTSRAARTFVFGLIESEGWVLTVARAELSVRS